MKKALLAVVAVAALAGSYIAYPYYCVNRLSDAVRSDDRARLADMVDWSSVRHGLKADLIALMTQSVPRPAAYNPGQALGRAVIEMLGPRVVDNIVETYATPAGLSGLIRNGGEIDVKAAVAKTAASMADDSAKAAGAASKATDAGNASGAGDVAGGAEAPANAGPASNPMPPIVVKDTCFITMDRMEVAYEDPGDTGKLPVKGILTLQGLRWKLTRIVLPVDEMLERPQMAERPATQPEGGRPNGDAQ